MSASSICLAAATLRPSAEPAPPIGWRSWARCVSEVRDARIRSFDTRAGAAHS